MILWLPLRGTLGIWWLIWRGTFYPCKNVWCHNYLPDFCVVKKTMYAKKTRFITWSDDHFFISGLKSLHSEWRFIESRRFPSEKKMRSALKKKSENSIFIVKVNVENIHFFSKILGFLLANDILTVCFIDVPVKVRPNPKGSVFFYPQKRKFLKL